MSKETFFQQEDEILNNDMEEKEYGCKTFIPPSLTDSDSYWHQASEKCFNLSCIYGPPSFFLTVSMNPYWIEAKALKRSNGNFSDSAMISIIFKTKLQTLLRYIQDKNTIGKVNSYVYRIKYQKRGLPHAHILFWTDIDTSDTVQIDKYVTARYPKQTPILNDSSFVNDMRVLIDRYQIHKHSKRCGKNCYKECCFHYPQDISNCTKIVNHQFILARNDNERMIVPFNLEMLALLRCHQCLEPFLSDQCIAYILKYCTKNSDLGTLKMKELKCEGRKVTIEKKTSLNITLLRELYQELNALHQ